MNHGGKQVVLESDLRSFETCRRSNPPHPSPRVILISPAGGLIVKQQQVNKQNPAAERQTTRHDTTQTTRRKLHDPTRPRLILLIRCGVFFWAHSSIGILACEKGRTHVSYRANSINDHDANSTIHSLHTAFLQSTETSRSARAGIDTARTTQIKMLLFHSGHRGRVKRGNFNTPALERHTAALEIVPVRLSAVGTLVKNEKAPSSNLPGGGRGQLCTYSPGLFL